MKLSCIGLWCSLGLVSGDDAGYCDYSTYDLEIVQVQDATDTFCDDMDNLASNVEVLIDTLASKYGSIKYGLSSFTDKPVPIRGYGPYGGYQNRVVYDYCYLSHSSLTSDSSAVKDAVSSIFCGSGADAPENQLEAVMYAAQDENMGWSTESVADNGNLILKLAVLVTDAYPHVEGDNAATTTWSWNWPRSYGSTDVPDVNAPSSGGFGADDFCDCPSQPGRTWCNADLYPEQYPELAQLCRKIDFNLTMTDDDVSRFYELVDIFGPYDYPDPIQPHPGYYDPRKCGEVEYPSDATFAQILKDKSIMPIIMVAKPIVDSYYTKNCPSLGYDGSTQTHECLIAMYQSILDSEGIEGVVAVLGEDSSDLADAVLSAIGEISEYVCAHTTTSMPTTTTTKATTTTTEPTTTTTKATTTTTKATTTTTKPTTTKTTTSSTSTSSDSDKCDFEDGGCDCDFVDTTTTTSTTKATTTTSKSTTTTTKATTTTSKSTTTTTKATTTSTSSTSTSSDSEKCDFEDGGCDCDFVDTTTTTSTNDPAVTTTKTTTSTTKATTSTSKSTTTPKAFTTGVAPETCSDVSRPNVFFLADMSWKSGMDSTHLTQLQEFVDTMYDMYPEGKFGYGVIGDKQDENTMWCHKTVLDLSNSVSDADSAIESFDFSGSVEAVAQAHMEEMYRAATQQDWSSSDYSVIVVLTDAAYQLNDGTAENLTDIGTCGDGCYCPGPYYSEPVTGDALREKNIRVAFMVTSDNVDWYTDKVTTNAWTDIATVGTLDFNGNIGQQVWETSFPFCPCVDTASSTSSTTSTPSSDSKKCDFEDGGCDCDFVEV